VLGLYYFLLAFFRKSLIDLSRLGRILGLLWGYLEMVKEFLVNLGLCSSVTSKCKEKWQVSVAATDTSLPMTWQVTI